MPIQRRTGYLEEAEQQRQRMKEQPMKLRSIIVVGQTVAATPNGRLLRIRAKAGPDEEETAEDFAGGTAVGR